MAAQGEFSGMGIAPDEADNELWYLWDNWKIEHSLGIEDAKASFTVHFLFHF